MNYINHRNRGADAKRQAIRPARLASVPLFVALLFCASLFGQSATPETQVHTFHIHGTVRTYTNAVAPNVEISFESDGVNKILIADGNGLYETDLPVGSYTMIAKPLRQEIPPGLFTTIPPQEPSLLGLREYERPLFRVTSSKNITLDIVLDSVGAFCDYGTGAESPDEKICEGLDSFRIPSQDKVPFELSIRYRSRQRMGKGYSYNTSKIDLGLKPQVFVAYNLFTLRADRVAYDVQDHTLAASGKIVETSIDGVTQTADAMAFKIENGEAIPLP